MHLNQTWGDLTRSLVVRTPASDLKVQQATCYNDAPRLTSLLEKGMFVLVGHQEELIRWNYETVRSISGHQFGSKYCRVSKDPVRNSIVPSVMGVTVLLSNPYFPKMAATLSEQINSISGTYTWKEVDLLA